MSYYRFILYVLLWAVNFVFSSTYMRYNRLGRIVVMCTNLLSIFMLILFF
ncbi:unnamed protein product [Brassica napus]|uniref:(rape) hypothetical protein n=1 Tax=Brassica napus TaxID=3708 RepID=A0A816W145_BRANA|nr:unnamed protein product [Brassica napus]